MKNSILKIPLIGQGTGDVESFASYLQRASYEHGVYVGEFIRYLFRYYYDDSYRGALNTEKPGYFKVDELIRVAGRVSAVVDLVGRLTDQDMYQSTFWVLETCLSRSIGEVEKNYRWCPECWSEMHHLGQEPYYKLIWHLSAVSVCPTHKTKLLERCFMCGARQNSYKRDHKISYCLRCGEELYSKIFLYTRRAGTNSWNMVGNDVLEFISDISRWEKTNHDFMRLDMSLSWLKEKYIEQGNEEEFYKLVVNSGKKSDYEIESPISFKLVRRLAYRLGVSIYTVLSGDLCHSTPLLINDKVCNLQPDFMDIKQRIKKDHDLVFIKIKAAIDQSEAPLSLRNIAHKVGVSVGYLRYRYPVLSKNIVDKHKSHIERIKLKKHLDAQLSAFRFFMDEKYALHAKSRKQAYKVLREETGLPKFVLKSAIQTAYSALSLSNIVLLEKNVKNSK